MKKATLLLAIVLTSFSSVFSQIQDNCKLDIGINLAGVEDFSREIPFANLMKMSREWYTKGENDPDFEWDTGHADLLSYDQNGYPTHIPQTLNGIALPQQVATVWDGTDSWPIGNYTLIWEGTGDFEFWGDHSNLIKVNDNRYEFDYLNPVDGILQITMTYSDISDPINNMRLLLPNTESTYLTQPFNPIWLQELSPFKTLRFMDWGQTNFWGQPDEYTWDIPDLVDWSERAKVNFYTYTGNKGVPYELMVQLINELEIDGWICVPHRASNDYVASMADFFKEQCYVDRHLYIEYSNEIWNWIFGQTQWLNKYGADTQDISWPEGIVPYIQNTLDIWTSSFSGQLDRITRVAAVQTGWLDVSERIVYNLNPNTVDAVSPTFYFSFDDAADAVLDNLGSSATVADIAFHTRQSMQSDMDLITDIKTIADSINVDLIFYEGGQHMTPTPFGDVPTYEGALLDIQRDEEMYNLYNEWLDTLRTINDTEEPMLLMHFSFISPLNAQYGSWGLLESMNQDLVNIPAPKYQAIIENKGCPVLSNSMTDIQEQMIKLYPNPTAGLVQIIGLTSSVNISIYDITGKLYQQISPNTSEEVVLNLANLPSGFYLIEISQPENNFSQMEKIIKM